MTEALPDWGVEFIFCKLGKPEGRAANLSLLNHTSCDGAREGSNRNLSSVPLHRRGAGGAVPPDDTT